MSIEREQREEKREEKRCEKEKSGKEAEEVCRGDIDVHTERITRSQLASTY